MPTLPPLSFNPFQPSTPSTPSSPSTTAAPSSKHSPPPYSLDCMSLPHTSTTPSARNPYTPSEPYSPTPSQAAIEEPIPNYPSRKHNNLQERDQSPRQAQPHPACPLYPQHRTDNQDFLPSSCLARYRSLHAMHSLYPHLGNANPKTKAQLSFLPQWTDADGKRETGGVRYGETLQGLWPDFLDLDPLTTTAAAPGPVLDVEKMEANFTSSSPSRSRLGFSLPAGRGRGMYMDGKEEEGYGYGGQGWEDIPLDEGWRIGCWGLGLGVLVGFGGGVCVGLVMRGILGLE